MKKIFLVLACVVGLLSCSVKEKPIKIAYDRSFFGYQLAGQNTNFYGFMEELLITLAKEKKMNFELIEANLDAIQEEFDKGKYDLIFSFMIPYNFNVAKYEFSPVILSTGPVLLVAGNKKYYGLKKMSNKHIGVVKGENSILILQKYPEIFPQSYDNLPKLLQDLQYQNIDGALINYVAACAYVNNIYPDLKIVMPPLTDDGIRLIAKKEQHSLLNKVNEGLKALKHNKKLNALKEKWGFCD